MNFLSGILGYIMLFSYRFVGNYGLSIIAFSLITKILLLPVSLWVHKNSIKVVKLQLELNNIKILHFGDPDQIADKSAELYKREKYNPFASLIPLTIQLCLLIGLVGVIYTPFNNILPLPRTEIEELVSITEQVTGANPDTSSIQLSVVETIQNEDYVGSFSSISNETVNMIRKLNFTFADFDLARAPVQEGGVQWLIPFLAGGSALLLSLIQSKLNSLQAEQSLAEKIGTTAFSVGLSFFVGMFVPAGVGFYWIWSNLFTIAQQYLLNHIIDPKKVIDYRALENSKQELENLHRIGERKLFVRDPNSKREKADYEHFFSIANKHLVFYSEKSGFYKYFQNVIEYLLKHSNIVIHYITSDPNDGIFQKAKEQSRIKPYYIGEKKLITLMMKMDADMVVMTMPDLDNFHIKRSYVRKDVEYVYMFHAPLSFIMTIRDGALDHYDTIFCTGPHQVLEVRESEKLYHLPKKQLVKCGYGVIENMRQHYLENKALYQTQEKKKILIAPSWQEDNILDSCLKSLLNSILRDCWQVIVRPHPEYIKRYPQKWQQILDHYKDYPEEKLVLQTDFSSNETVYSADILITDWSWIAYEYSLATRKPTLFVNTAMKVANPNYDKLPLTPLNLSLRGEIGVQLEKNEVSSAGEKIADLLDHTMDYENKINQIAEQYLFHFGHSGEIGGRYIIQSLKQKAKQRISVDAGEI